MRCHRVNDRSGDVHLGLQLQGINYRSAAYKDDLLKNKAKASGLYCVARTERVLGLGNKD